MPLYRAWVSGDGPYRCFCADNNDMPKEIGFLKELMQKELLSSCLLGYTKDQSTGKTVCKLTIGTHELPPQEMKLINMCIKEKLIPELLKQNNMPQVDIPFVSVLFLLQPLDSKAQDVIPIQRPYQRPPTSDDPMDKMPSVSCVFAFKEGLSLLTFSHLIGDITCLDLA